jgi:hypothetical protein
MSAPGYKSLSAMDVFAFSNDNRTWRMHSYSAWNFSNVFQNVTPSKLINSFKILNKSLGTISEFLFIHARTKNGDMRGTNKPALSLSCTLPSNDK